MLLILSHSPTPLPSFQTWPSHGLGGLGNGLPVEAGGGEGGRGREGEGGTCYRYSAFIQRLFLLLVEMLFIVCCD